jgi:hypothetical protein
MDSVPKAVERGKKKWQQGPGGHFHEEIFRS